MRSRYLAGALLVLAIAPVEAQKSNTQGFMGNVHLSAVGMTRPKLAGAKSENESGGGAGLRLGWGFSPNFTMYVGLDGAKLDFKGANTSGEYTAAFVDVGVTYYFAKPSRALVPYIEVAATGRAIGSTDPADAGSPEIEFVQGGGGFSLGAGINYYFTRAAALNVGLSLSGGDFENAELNDVEQPNTGGSAASSRLTVGLTFFPMKK